jgi:hypothetical protein
MMKDALHQFPNIHPGEAGKKIAQGMYNRKFVSDSQWKCRVLYKMDQTLGRARDKTEI